MKMRGIEETREARPPGSLLQDFDASGQIVRPWTAINPGIFIHDIKLGPLGSRAGAAAKLNQLVVQPDHYWLGSRLYYLNSAVLFMHNWLELRPPYQGETSTVLRLKKQASVFINDKPVIDSEESCCYNPNGRSRTRLILGLICTAKASCQ